MSSIPTCSPLPPMVDSPAAAARVKNGNGNSLTDLVPGVTGWARQVANIGFAAFFAAIMGYLVVVQMPRQFDESMREIRDLRDRDETRTQKLIDTMSANQKELVGALNATRQATEELTLEVKHLRTAKTEPDRVVPDKKP